MLEDQLASNLRVNKKVDILLTVFSVSIYILSCNNNIAVLFE